VVSRKRPYKRAYESQGSQNSLLMDGVPIVLKDELLFSVSLDAKLVAQIVDFSSYIAFR
jgi:hypothetical protein